MIRATILILAFVLAPFALAQDTSLSPDKVFSRLTDRYTDVQREAYFDGEAKGQQVAWKMRVADIKKGWWNYDLLGSVGRGRELLCKVKISETTTKRIASIAKGTSLTCTGKIKTYTRIFGLMVLIEDAEIN